MDSCHWRLVSGDPLGGTVVKRRISFFYAFFFFLLVVRIVVAFGRAFRSLGLFLAAFVSEMRPSGGVVSSRFSRSRFRMPSTVCSRGRVHPGGGGGAVYANYDVFGPK